MPGAAANEFVRQHLIDPEICIRCNTCEEICPSKAISHDNVNYVVDFAKCVGKGDCLPPCPTGAIDNWRRVARPLTVTEQFALESLPPDAEPVISGGGGPVPDDVQRITAEASAGSGGCEVPPWSAAHPYVSLYAPEAPAKAIVSGNYRLTEPGSSVDIHHLVLDFGKTAFPVLEGQSIGILPPGLDETGKPHHVRLYSVASPREGERPGYNNVALSIKRVVEDATGRRVHGIASNYMCDLKKGDEVKVTGPYGTTFLMPNNPGANIIMICTGTGSAPMRAMTERLRR
ncbi:MAG: 4Fe-4S binding protein, partial [Alphaproteobacteria bacterium]